MDPERVREVEKWFGVILDQIEGEPMAPVVSLLDARVIPAARAALAALRATTDQANATPGEHDAT